MAELAAYVCGTFYTVGGVHGEWLTTPADSREAVGYTKRLELTGARPRPRRSKARGARVRADWRGALTASTKRAWNR
jgi:hypothetical protein